MGVAGATGVEPRLYPQTKSRSGRAGRRRRVTGHNRVSPPKNGVGRDRSSATRRVPVGGGGRFCLTSRLMVRTSGARRPGDVTRLAPVGDVVQQAAVDVAGRLGVGVGHDDALGPLANSTLARLDRSPSRDSLYHRAIGDGNVQLDLSVCPTPSDR